MDKRFLTAFITPKEWDVIGYKLKHYSIRMHINLTAVDSPYVTGQVPSAADTLAFLKYCSSDCGSIIDLPKTNLYDTVAYMRLKYDRVFHANTIRMIANYMKEHTSGPNYRIASKTAKQISTIVSGNGMPEILMLASVCMQKLNMTEEDVMSSTIGKLSWYAAAATALEGADVRLSAEEENYMLEMSNLAEWENSQAEKLRLAMVNGKIPKKRIKTSIA